MNEISAKQVKWAAVICRRDEIGNKCYDFDVISGF
jgi:hypothetical protein